MQQAEERHKGLIGRVASAATERVVETIDPDVVLDHVDVEALVNRVDVQRLVDRLDLDAVLARVDVEALVQRIDVEALVRRSGVPDLILATSGQLAGSTLDLVRRQLVGLDVLVDRVVDRVVRRTERRDDLAPELLRTESTPLGARSPVVSGRYAGPASRLAAGFLDLVTIVATFTAALAAFDFLAGIFGVTATEEGHWAWPTLVLAVWGFVYTFAGVAVAGRTPGKGLVGLRVVRADGGVVSGAAAFGRTCVYVVCVAFLFIAFLPVVFDRCHRGLQDLAAGSAVVYDWGERPAEMPAPLSAYLARRDAA